MVRGQGEYGGEWLMTVVAAESVVSVAGDAAASRGNMMGSSLAGPVSRTVAPVPTPTRKLADAVHKSHLDPRLSDPAARETADRRL